MISHPTVANSNIFYWPTILCMRLGELSGSITTKGFSFKAEARVRKLDYVSVKDPEGRWVLGIVDSVVTDSQHTRIRVKVIGYRDGRGFLKTPKIPFRPEAPVYAAEKKFINQVLGIKESGAYLGLLEGYDIKVRLPVKRMISKHVCVLAKTGAGKSYATAVLLEELAEAKIPVVVVDPHGEYHTLRRKKFLYFQDIHLVQR